MCKSSSKLLIALFFGCATFIIVSCSYLRPTPDTSALSPLLKQHHLRPSDPHLAGQHELMEIEQADSSLYKPLASDIIFLQADALMGGQKGLRPRYWLVVEDYPNGDLAKQRAAEYIDTNTYARVAEAYGRGTTGHMISKLTVRRWAVAQGRRVYALTTDAEVFAESAVVGELKESVSKLPET